MLSILIPVYNYDVTDLVEALYKQASEQMINFEIVVLEDGSTQFLDINNQISKLKYCRYEQLTSNIGRAAIRNKLAELARFDQMLFLDCDAAITSDFFIAKYLGFCNEVGVVLGGRIYDDRIKLPKYSLIGKYGAERERNNLSTTQQRQTYPMFTTPNFLIHKAIFNKIKFDENIKGYGHEDTVFGIMLHRLNVDFIFIDNPVLHVGIEDNGLYLSKNEEAINNLLLLYRGNDYPELVKESKLTSYFVTLKKCHLIGFFAFFYRMFGKSMKSQLCSSDPSLFIFDLYKLTYMCNIDRK